MTTPPTPPTDNLAAEGGPRSEMSEQGSVESGLPRLKWQGQATRVEHLVAAGGWLTRPGKHVASCTCRCADIQTCPECGQPSSPTAIAGRWDAEAGHTARPFDAVWVRLWCGCEFGDYSLSQPPEATR